MRRRGWTAVARISIIFLLTISCTTGPAITGVVLEKIHHLDSRFWLPYPPMWLGHAEYWEVFISADSRTYRVLISQDTYRRIESGDRVTFHRHPNAPGGWRLVASEKKPS